jgi:electron transfer flavoprotein beta subunit
LNIVVPIKQVPETSNVAMDPETGTMVRSGVETVVNPLDLYAIEAAVQIKEQHGGTVTAITMGPLLAEKALREAIAMGCDSAVLLSDPKFGGADTWATSYTIGQGIRKLEEASGPIDLVVAGERATDGDTAQVGPGIAAWLDLPVATYVTSIDEITSTSIVVERLVEEGYQIVELQLPALLTVVKEIAAPRLPTLKGKRYARTAEIPRYGSDALDLDPTYLGLKGSPTKVVKIATPRVTRGGTIVQANDESSTRIAVDRLLSFLDERGLLPEEFTSAGAAQTNGVRLPGDVKQAVGDDRFDGGTE